MKLSQLGPVIGRGRSADIFALDEARVLKLFNTGVSPAHVAYEFCVAQAVVNSGVAAPRAHDLVDVEGRSGIVYERVHGTSMLKRLSSQPWAVKRLAGILADAHVSIHARTTTADGLPAQRERMLRIIDRLGLDVVSADEKANVLTALQQQPDGTALCHGDFHPDNVLLTNNGPRIIDWNNATVGNPNADVQWTLWVLQHAPTTGDAMSGFMRMMETWVRRVFVDAYFNRYIAVSRAWKLDIDAWRVPNAAVRLDDGILEERAMLLEIIRGARPRD
jgi:uncharacterized protein (TIGR02172 family)